MLGADLYRNSLDPLFEPANKLVTEWFDRVYAGLTSDDQEPIARRRIAKQPSPSRTPDGETVSAVVRDIGDDLIENAAGGAVKPQVTRLQTALNQIASGPITLKPDGVLGPKTHTLLRNVLARTGMAPLQRAFSRTRG